MFSKMVSVKSHVESALRKNPKARDNDITLYFDVLDSLHGLSRVIGTDAYKKLIKLVHSSHPPESVRRTRQKLQEKGFYLGTVRAKRKVLATEVTDNIHTL